MANRALSVGLAVLAVVLAGPHTSGSLPAAEIASPLSPEDSLAHLHVEPGLAVELVACEPEVIDPVEIRFDERGRLWVVEMRGYPTGPPEGEPPRSRIRVLEDRDGDGRPDAWERYEDGLLNVRTLDEDGDGVRDTFFRYAGGQLVERLRDSNNDGTTDLVETYADRQRTRTEEDRSLNGATDTWVTYQRVDGREVVASIHRDTRDTGRPDRYFFPRVLSDVTDIQITGCPIDGGAERIDRKSTRLNSSHTDISRMPSSA